MWCSSYQIHPTNSRLYVTLFRRLHSFLLSSLVQFARLQPPTPSIGTILLFPQVQPSVSRLLHSQVPPSTAWPVRAQVRGSLAFGVAGARLCICGGFQVRNHCCLPPCGELIRSHRVTRDCQLHSRCPNRLLSRTFHRPHCTLIVAFSRSPAAIVVKNTPFNVERERPSWTSSSACPFSIPHPSDLKCRLLDPSSFITLDQSGQFRGLAFANSRLLVMPTWSSNRLWSGHASHPPTSTILLRPICFPATTVFPPTATIALRRKSCEIP